MLYRMYRYDVATKEKQPKYIKAALELSRSISEELWFKFRKTYGQMCNRKPNPHFSLVPFNSNSPTIPIKRSFLIAQ